MKKAIAVFLFAFGFSAGVFAEWSGVATLSTSAKQQEVVIHQPVSKVLIVCVDGAITVEKISLVIGDKTIPFQMNSQISKGERQQVTVGSHASCDKIQLLVTGQGRFELKVRP